MGIASIISVFSFVDTSIIEVVSLFSFHVDKMTTISTSLHKTTPKDLFRIKHIPELKLINYFDSLPRTLLLIKNFIIVIDINLESWEDNRLFVPLYYLTDKRVMLQPNCAGITPWSSPVKVVHLACEPSVGLREHCVFCVT